MKRSALVTLLAACLAMPAAAQVGSFSLELGGARSTNSPIFEQAVTDNAFATSTVTRLAVADAGLGTVRVGYRIAGPWMLLANLGHGSMQYVYTRDVSIPSLGSNASTATQTGRATRTTFGLAVAHRTALVGLPLSIEPELGFALHRLTVGNPGVQCTPQPPTLGGPPNSCVTSQQWEQVYSVPSVSGGVSLGYAIAPQIGVELRGLYAVGRTSTEKGFYVDLLPQYDYAEAPKSRVIRSTQLSVGLRVSP